MTAPAWEAVLPGDPRGQPSAMYRGLVCYVSTDPAIAVVTVDGQAVPPDRWPAVAQLIAAAPDLVEALATLRRVCSDIPAIENNPRFAAASQAALAALTKAGAL